MNIQAFRKIVEGAAPGIAVCDGNLHRLYDYVGLRHGSHYTQGAVSDALHARIKDCFTSGHAEVQRTCMLLRKDLIYEHVLNGTPLDPYFEVLNHLCDAVRVPGNPRAPIEGDWNRAIQGALDHMRIRNRGDYGRERIYARDFAVANEAHILRDAGFAIRSEPGRLRLEDGAETALIAEIEGIVAIMGGINVARRIFRVISQYYDADQQRYHVVPRISTDGNGQPQIPWGYLIQLAAKYTKCRKKNVNTNAHWHKLCGLSRAFAAVIDVQPYGPTFYGTMDAIALLPYLQGMAVHDTLFRIVQMRPTDVIGIARGLLNWMDITEPTKAGWSIDQVLEIIDYLLNPARDVRGPITIEIKDILRTCPGIPPEIVTQLLNEVLSHPPIGANQNFSRPTDAPIPEIANLMDVGHDFFLRPLLRLSDRRFILLDRSMCAPACLEALFTPLRQETKGFDDNVGLAIEQFLIAKFASHGVSTCGGHYNANGEHGECDLIIDTPETVIFAEVKKKVLTRRARAGSIAHLLLDLAGSLLAAQAQTGWHMVRLHRDRKLELKRSSITTRIELNGRDVERIAVSLFDFGSFQDRILLKQFLEATVNATFTPYDVSLNKKFDEINKAFVEIREQVSMLYANVNQRTQPFFNCWFISVPQLLILLDDVTDGAGFKKALWSCRHIVTGSSDLYYDLSYMKRLKNRRLHSPTKPETS